MGGKARPLVDLQVVRGLAAPLHGDEVSAKQHYAFFDPYEATFPDTQPDALDDFWGASNGMSSNNVNETVT